MVGKGKGQGGQTGHRGKQNVPPETCDNKITLGGSVGVG